MEKNIKFKKNKKYIIKIKSKEKKKKKKKI